MFKAGLNIVFFILAISTSFGQKHPKIQFLSDSVLLGQHTKLVLIHSHKPNLEVTFPDSSFNFTPFEFVSKNPFTTKTNDSISIDCTIYTLRTFELKPYLSIQLPIFIQEQKDSFQIFSNTDSIALKEVIITQPDSVKLKSNTDFAPIYKPFNYPYFYIGISAFLLLIVMIALLFGKKILSYFKAYRLKKQFEKFEVRYKEMSSEIENPLISEQLIQLWKNYLTNLENNRLNSMSTKEIQMVFNEEVALINTLKKIDELIYGNIKLEHANEKAELLFEFAKNKYLTHIKRFKNDK